MPLLLPKSSFPQSDPPPLIPWLSIPPLLKPPFPKSSLIVKTLYHEYYIKTQMPDIDLNDSDTTCGKSFSNAFFETISTNCKNEQGKIHKGRIKNISVFNNQFFLGQKQFRPANIDTQLMTKPGPPKNLLRYF